MNVRTAALNDDPRDEPPAARRLLPPGFSRFVGRRAADLAALVACVCGLTILIALATHTATDPSFNTASSARIVNLAGPVGAALSDALLQGFGIAAFLPGIIPMIWAGRLVTGRSLGGPAWRLVALTAAVPVAAAIAAMLPGTIGGGAVGQIVLGAVVGGGRSLLGPLGVVIAASLAIGAAFVLTVAASGLGFGGGAAAPIQPVAPRPPGALRRAAAAAWSGAAGALVALRTRRAAGDTPPLRRAEPKVADAAPFAEPSEADQPAPAPRPAKPRVAPTPEPPRRATAPAQGALPLDGASWSPPPLSLLDAPSAQRVGRPDDEALEANARMLEGVLGDFGVQGRITAIRPGPVVTLYELEPAPGTKSSRVIGLADDIARSMSQTSVRVAVVPGRNAIGIEMPNSRRETVWLSELMGAEDWGAARGRLNIILGKDIAGGSVVVDLAAMPHLLIAGTTGAGKSVALNTMILSVLMRLSPDECRFIMIDPKMLELSVYDRIPHLLSPVVTEPAKAVAALKWAVREMERRYRLMSQLGVRNIGGYNARVAEAAANGETLSRRVQTGFDPETNKPTYEDQPFDLRKLPFIVVVVDEMADLMIVAGKEIEAAVQRLAQMARAAGIHILMATQRPSVDVITGVIKANFPIRISFRVVSKIDSRTILGCQGAEQLLGQGDMLYMASGGRILRVHGPFVSDTEVERVVEHLRRLGEPDYVDEVTEADAASGAATAESGPLPGLSGGGPLAGEEGDENTLYDQAVAVVAREGKASTSFIQRHLMIGYNRAARLIERMEKEGVVGTPNHVGKREILVRRTHDED